MLRVQLNQFRRNNDNAAIYARNYFEFGHQGFFKTACAASFCHSLFFSGFERQQGFFVFSIQFFFTKWSLINYGFLRLAIAFPSQCFFD